jgi:hypothetical protein
LEIRLAGPGRTRKEPSASVADKPSDLAALAADDPDAVAAVGEEPAPWPSEAEESAFLARSESAAVAAPAVEAIVSDAGPPLPALDLLVERIPAEVRAALDEHFRAKFTSVRRIPESVKLK